MSEINAGLEQVANLDEDRIIRRFLNLIQCTLRTNYFQATDDGRPRDYISFKFDARGIEELRVGNTWLEWATTVQRIVEDEKIRMNVPIHIVGEQQSPGVKLGGGTVMRLLTEVEVSCLPRDLPEYFEVDISHLELDQMLYLSDIKVPEGVEIIELTYGEDHDDAIVSVHVMKSVAVEEEASAEDEVPAQEQGKSEPERD